MLLELPEEVALCICSFLTTRDLFSLACVCIQLEEVTTDPFLWKELFESSRDKTITLSPPDHYIHDPHGDEIYNHNWKLLCQHARKFDTITAALLEALPGGVIYVRPGVYEDNFTINKPVHIIGIGGDSSKVVIENKPNFGRVLIVDIPPLDDDMTPSTPPLIHTPPQSWAPPSPTPGMPTPPLSPALPHSPTYPLTPSSLSTSPSHGDSMFSPHTPPMPSVRGCTFRQKVTTPLNFCVEITSGSVLIEDCIITSESLSCICVQKDGTPIIRKNSIYGTSAGLTMFECASETLVEDNQFFSNHFSAIEISQFANPLVRRNTIYDGKSAGIFIFENGKGVIEGNNIYANASSGIEVAREASPIVIRNKIHHGKGCGISVYDKSTGVFEENLIYDNFESNIYISRQANPIFTNNKIFRSKLSGVYIHHEGAGILEGNEIYENMNEGVATVDDSNPKLVNNIVRDNKRAGIVVYDRGMGYFEKNIVTHNIGGIEVRRMGKPILVDNVLIDNEIVPAELRACIERGECTFSATGVSFFPQYWWYCDTCEGGGDKGCCAACAQVCHKGHKISQRKFSLFYCDCGAEWCCRVMPNRKQQNAMFD